MDNKDIKQIVADRYKDIREKVWAGEELDENDRVVIAYLLTKDIMTIELEE